MKRLTQMDESGNWCLEGVPWKELYQGSVISRNTSELLYGALCKLLDYEKTGLSPDEVEAAKESARDKFRECIYPLLKELKKYQWHPLTSGIPTDSGEYLVTMINEWYRDGKPFTNYLSWDYGGWKWIDFNGEEVCGEVIA